MSINSAYAGTTTADFLTWERKAQDSFFQISITMAGFVAAQVRPKMAECINDWYFEGDALQTKRHAEILKQMPQYVDFQPTAVVLGFLESACGSLKNSD